MYHFGHFIFSYGGHLGLKSRLSGTIWKKTTQELLDFAKWFQRRRFSNSFLLKISLICIFCVEEPT